MRPVKVKHLIYLIFLLILILIIDQSGILLHLKTKDYYKDFKYPHEGDILPSMENLRRGEDPKLPVINPHNYLITSKARGKCQEPQRVVYIVKSALENFKKRQIIRKTWGYEKRFSDVGIQTVFLLGSNPQDSNLMSQIREEYEEFGDIVQGDFIDSYWNNTLKTMMGLRWATEFCNNARFYAFFDDDYYVSTRNLLRFLRNPTNFPHYLEEDVIHFDSGRKLKQLVDFDLPEDVKLYSGFVFHSRPHRHKFSKWFLDLEEYPFHLWPPYVTAGGFILSKNALKDFYYASYFVKRFRFDDVYLGLIAKKLEIEPFHCEEFNFYKKLPISPQGYRYTVASHGFSDPENLERVWNKQKEAGNA